MAEIDHEKIRIVAYELWEQDGSPAGKDDDYWHAAVKLLSDEAHAGSHEEPEAVLPMPPIPELAGKKKPTR